MIHDRTRHIFNVGVRDYIKTGHPITSERLYERYDFGIKPAMIRWELHALTEGGWLVQPHPSGGRIPSDKGYRVFVESLRSAEPDKDAESVRENKMREAISASLLDADARRLVRTLAAYLGVLSLWYEPHAGVVMSGINALFSGLEDTNPEELMCIAADCEALFDAEYMRRAVESTAVGEPTVMIGKNRLTKSPHLSIIILPFGTAPAPYMVMVGQKRMPYETVIGLCNYLLKEHAPYG